MTPGPDDDALAVVRAADLDDGDTLPRWLVDTLWARSAVGVLGGAPKSCLCRARDKQDYPARGVMPRPPALPRFSRRSRRSRRSPRGIIRSRLPLGEDIDAPFVIDFLDWLEAERKITPRTRNSRLAALRSFFRHVSMNEPAHALRCQRILAVPQKRSQKRTIEFLGREEIEALVAAPDTSTWIGRRDRTLLLVLVQTGLRVSELTSLRRNSVVLGAGAHVKCEGKGRKCRCTPLRRDAISALTAWLDEHRAAPEAPLFPSSGGGTLSTDAVERLVEKHAKAAGGRCLSIVEKNVTPHVLRHSAAMALREQGVDLSVIALWLGHESVETTQMYLHADIRMKEKALARTASIEGEARRFQPEDALTAYLESL